MSDGDDRNADEPAQGSTSSGPADGRLTPEDLKKLSRSVQSLIRQGVIVPNGGDYAPPGIQDDDGDGEPVE